MDGITKINKRLRGITVANGFGTWEQYLINSDNYNLSDYSCILILLDGDELRQKHPDTAEVLDIISLIGVLSEKYKSTRIYLSNIHCRIRSIISIEEMNRIDKYENCINNAIYDICSTQTNIACYNLKKVIGFLGENEAYSGRMEYLSSCPFSVKALQNIAKSISELDYFREITRKKCLVVDLDNTLWGGVVGEEGEDNVVISSSKEGKAYYDFQNILLKIKSSGIILAIASKNNPEDVKAVFDKREMPLKESDFVISKISWNPKSVSIREMSEELNIGLDSMVFLDDNPAERSEVKRELPMVEVPEFPEDVFELESFALAVYDSFFRTDKVLAEDLTKSEMYIANAERSKLKASFSDIDSFLKSLDMTLAIGAVDEGTINRAAQMTQKTNQFNLTTKRYSDSDIIDMISNNNVRIYIGKVKDRFGDNGITNLCIVNINGEKAEIDEFLMSCRVMERKIEYDFLRYIENDLLQSGIKTLIGRYIATPKNKPSAIFLEKYGFNKINEDGLYRKSVEKSDYSGLLQIIGM